MTHEIRIARRAKQGVSASGAARRVSRALGVFSIAALAAFASGCGDDDENPMVPEADEPDRSTPSALLTAFFETAYSSQDSTLYREMLDDDFRFEFLHQDAESVRAIFGADILGTDDAWDRNKDIQSTEAMFGSSSITGITLNLLVNSNTALPDTNGCADCQRLEATVTLRVATVGDGTEPLIFTVDSPQTFIAKRDPADTARWVIWRQYDRPRSAPLAFGAGRATESTTWGQIKGLSFPAPPRPRRDTPALLLTDFFETAYARQDSALYAEMLDAGFQFEFLQQDADSLRDILDADVFWWGRTSDLKSTRNMFRSDVVTGVTLNLQVNANSAYPGPDCADCRQIETTVTLRVATIGDGTEPLIFAIDSPQTFVVKPDPANSLWTLFRQIDRPRTAATPAPSGLAMATESLSWGNLKGLFR